VRYKQTALGVLWVLLQPLLMALLFSIIFGAFAKVPSNGFPYPILVFAALPPWQLFAHALATSHSLVIDQQLISKVYFPRLLVPLANVLAGALDFAITLIVLFVLMASYGIAFTPAIWTLPLLILLVLMAAIGVATWLSALNAQFRDVQYAIPFLTQVWLLATPVAYSTDLVPERWRLVFALNPLVGIVDGFRFALLGQEPPLAISPYMAAFVIGALLISGLAYSSRVEETLADFI
jgi:lipopolysaccharide transport system permease protein